MVNNLSRCCSYSSLHSSTSGSSWIEVEEVEEQTSSKKLSDNFGTPKSFYEIVSGNEGFFFIFNGRVFWVGRNF